MSLFQMPCLVPTVNGYKRLVESYWAPVNGELPMPRRSSRDRLLMSSRSAVSYAYENRLASVRIISPPLAGRQATRLEVVRRSCSPPRTSADALLLHSAFPVPT